MNKPIQVSAVTGGGHGIGRALCHRLAKDGASVAVLDIDGDAATAVARDLGGLGLAVDVSEEAALIDAIERIEAELGPIDLFVSNAGVAFGDAASGAASAEGGLHPVDDRWNACWQINVMGHVYAARALLPLMRARGGGYLVNIASAAGLLSQIGDAAYTATKHAAVAFAESLAITHGEEGIQVSVVCPQAVATRMIGMGDREADADGGFGGNDVDGILSAETVADIIVEGLRSGRFLILPHARVAEYLRRKADDRDRWISGMQRFRQSLASED